MAFRLNLAGDITVTHPMSDYNYRRWLQIYHVAQSTGMCTFDAAEFAFAVIHPEEAKKRTNGKPRIYRLGNPTSKQHRKRAQGRAE